jgi:hypothetical protein
MTESGLFPYVCLIEAPGVAYPEGERFTAISAINEKPNCADESANAQPEQPRVDLL